MALRKEDKTLLAFGKAFFYTEECLFGKNEQKIKEFDTLENIRSKSNIEDLAIIADGIRFGWIQRIEIDRDNKTAKVGHFAVAKEYTGCGFGKRLAFAFGNKLKSKYGIKEILFIEQGQDDKEKMDNYSHFFEKKLIANKESITHGLYQWRWEIP